MIGIRVHVPVRRHFVDRGRQKSRQQLRSLRWIHAQLRRDRTDLVLPDDILDLLRRDRVVFARADPRLHFVVMSGLREFIQEPLDSAALGEKSGQHSEDRVRAAAPVFAALVLAAEN